MEAMGMRTTLLFAWRGVVGGPLLAVPNFEEAAGRTTLPLRWVFALAARVSRGLSPCCPYTGSAVNLHHWFIAAACWVVRHGA